jgi:predicted SnoaL-like aldol condensation-catalyzing enzyme
MSKIFFTAFLGLLCFCMSCNNANTDGSTSKDSRVQKNLEANHVVIKAFETGDVSGLDSVIADDYVDHTDRGDKKGRDSLKAMVSWVRSMNKDMKADIIKEAADDDYVFSWMTLSGDHDGTMGPKGPFKMKAIQVTKFNNDGKAVEHWEYMEPAEMMKMMGQTPGGDKMDMKKADSVGKNY